MDCLDTPDFNNGSNITQFISHPIECDGESIISRFAQSEANAMRLIDCLGASDG